MNRLPLLLLTIGAAGCCYLATPEGEDAGPTSGGGTTSGTSSGAGSTGGQNACVQAGGECAGANAGRCNGRGGGYNSSCGVGSACCFPTDGASSAGSNGGSTSAGSSSNGGASGGRTSGGSTGGGGACEPPAPGSCSGDADCVVAYCANWDCQCGGAAIARSQLGQNPCLIAEGAEVPAGCQPPPGIRCYCPAFAGCTAQCLAGTCGCLYTCAGNGTPCGGLCTSLASDSFNCGSCGNICPKGQECTNGACG